MGQDLNEVLSDWRFPAATVFIASFIGWWLYRLVPLPGGSLDHLNTMVRAAVVKHIAQRAGVPPLEVLSDIVGINEMAQVRRALKRQCCVCLVGAACAVAVALLPVYMYADMSPVPDWVFAVAAAFGVFRIWRMWR